MVQITVIKIPLLLSRLDQMPGRPAGLINQPKKVIFYVKHDDLMHLPCQGAQALALDQPKSTKSMIYFCFCLNPTVSTPVLSHPEPPTGDALRSPLSYSVILSTREVLETEAS